MGFVKIFLITLALCFVFAFFGGWMLFDFSGNYYLATAACALVIAAVVSGFAAQEEKIEELGKRVKALEEKE